MMHLIIHLAEELFVYGPIHTHWMYPMERYMKFLKDYVWTKVVTWQKVIWWMILLDSALSICLD
jgi:hypothetical protein